MMARRLRRSSAPLKGKSRRPEQWTALRRKARRRHEEGEQGRAKKRAVLTQSCFIRDQRRNFGKRKGLKERGKSQEK